MRKNPAGNRHVLQLDGFFEAFQIAFFKCFIGVLIAAALYSKTKDAFVQK